MNIANPCKLFFIVGALAAGLAVRADGTLPFPIAAEELPFLMMGEATERATSSVGTTTTVHDISMTLDAPDGNSGNDPKLKARCRANEGYFPASGTVQVAADLFNIQGVCAASATAPGPRQVIASSTGRVLQFDGNFVADLSKGKTFKGKLLTIDSVTTTPESGAVVTKTITFDLRQPGMPAGE